MKFGPSNTTIAQLAFLPSGFSCLQPRGGMVLFGASSGFPCSVNLDERTSAAAKERRRQDSACRGPVIPVIPMQSQSQSDTQRVVTRHALDLGVSLQGVGKRLQVLSEADPF